MRTINPKQINNTERKWYIVDAESQTLGRLATKIATILRWKNKIDFASHVDNWDYVIVLNAWKFKTTWNKENDKVYYKHSWYIWNLKTTTLWDLKAKKPTTVLKLAISGMLPKNRLKKDMLSRLKLQIDKTHKFEAQKPINLEI